MSLVLIDTTNKVYEERRATLTTFPIGQELKTARFKFVGSTYEFYASMLVQHDPSFLNK